MIDRPTFSKTSFKYFNFIDILFINRTIYFELDRKSISISEDIIKNIHSFSEILQSGN